MKQYDFDTCCDRRGSSCLKYDFAPQRVGRTDLLPLWVADMDFKLPDEILRALEVRVEHGFFGYTDPDDSYYAVLARWFWDHYGVRIDRSWNTVTPGIVYAILRHPELHQRGRCGADPGACLLSLPGDDRGKRQGLRLQRSYSETGAGPSL